jgi:hypothetical protein
LVTIIATFIIMFGLPALHLLLLLKRACLNREIEKKIPIKKNKSVKEIASEE